MKTVLLGLLLGLLAAFPHLAAPLLAAGRVVAVQPLLWAFCAGLAARPRIVRRFSRRIS
ncbi:hypothetical protein [Actinacidiphila acidipaludis]|uniref:Uncharacterized protein n=1 Tax=Actinacidiphila acidipaludis TaxID=2873382 RepID=A0ABS7Q9B1_9ACTN|nr:hypothetical protein [Streptomyces acidipaludis]MBY8879733.1 hypothetical protein [Streptomyces acidipaludis]